MHISLYLSEIFSEKSTTTLVFFSLYSLVFSVYSYDIFNIRIFLLTSGDSWYLPSGAEKTGLEVLCVRWIELVSHGLCSEVILFALIRRPSCHYLFSLAGQSRQKGILQSPLWRVCVGLPACRRRGLGQYLHFH